MSQKSRYVRRVRVYHIHGHARAARPGIGTVVDIQGRFLVIRRQFRPDWRRVLAESCVKYVLLETDCASGKFRGPDYLDILVQAMQHPDQAEWSDSLQSAARACVGAKRSDEDPLIHARQGD